MARQLRTEKAQVWLTPKEKALCMLLADQEGVSFSDWVRQAMLEKAGKEAGNGQ